MSRDDQEWLRHQRRTNEPVDAGPQIAVRIAFGVYLLFIGAAVCARWNA